MSLYQKKIRTNLLSRILARLVPMDPVVIARENILKLERDIQIFKPKTLCLNNLSPKKCRSGNIILESIMAKICPMGNSSG